MPEQPSHMPELLTPAPLEEPKAPDSVPQEPRRPNVFALGLAAVGLGLGIAAQYLPWSLYHLPDPSGRMFRNEPVGVADAANDTQTVELPLASLSIAHVAIYLVTLSFALVGLAVVLSTTGPVRRVAAGAAGGLLAANVMVLVGLQSALNTMSDVERQIMLYSSSSRGETTTGSGYLLAYAAVLVLAAAVVVAVRLPMPSGSASRARRKAGEPDGGEPLELTVTPVPPAFQ
ncbi:hypothetical protein ABT297_38545 [Dactylosporangium sp. NPDC000555]|uniref:hypothetical protein n=1 Tax=Dactylosporangium sp. NPDC000555 TaxID=3154260 RepID=UPI0033344214